MPKKVTMNSVYQTVLKSIIKRQDFSAAAAVREVQRLVDPKNNKLLTRKQASATKAFLQIVAGTAN
ncbi:MAG: hypothetical protein V4524_03470 [Patescibacteria group bacterium]